MNTKFLLAALTVGAVSLNVWTATAKPVVKRIYRDARVTRGNTNVIRTQDADDASWLWLPGDGGTARVGDRDLGPHPHGGSVMDPVFLKFRRAFEVKAGDGPLTIDVSADERYYLTVDGTFVSRGPNRSIVENWQYNTYEIRLEPGRHVMEAVVWKTGDKGPLAQLSWRGGFTLKAAGAYHERLTTGVAKWRVGKLFGIEPDGIDNGVWGTGAQWRITGAGVQDAEPSDWKDAEVVRGMACRRSSWHCGVRTHGWMLFPSQIPDQIERRNLPGRVVAVTEKAEWRGLHAYTDDEAKRTLDLSKPFVVPANTRLQLAWDLGVYQCAYPEVVLSGGKGARFSLCWAESAIRADTKLKGAEPGSRNAIVGRCLAGYGDTFVSDGRARGVFTVPWFRCGKWCRIDVETKDEPLTVESIALYESRSPLETEGAFASPDDPTLQDVRRIGARAMQMCCHEMLFDCPYYEQQMYPGDTRVQLNVLSAMTRDDRMIKRAIELFDLGARDDGQCPFNFPSRGTQEGATYTLCYLCMFGDYAMNHADRAWLRARIPGLRKSMAGMELYENADGLLENLPGWRFMDWVPNWQKENGAPPGGAGLNAEINLFWVLAMRSAATAERALGNELQARYWEEKCARLKEKVVAAFWSEARGLLADTPEKKDFSEHAQCLAIVGDVLPADKAEVAFRHLIADEDLDRCTVYFSYYLFEAYFKGGRGDLFLKRLDLWRTYVAKGLTTTQEAPDSGKNGQKESRSDCHAWGAHPIWHMQTGLAGIRPAAPFFEKVLVAPCPGGLRSLTARHPHPRGFVDVDLKFADGKATGTVRTPVAGTFVFGGQKIELAVGANEIK